MSLRIFDILFFEVSGIATFLEINLSISDVKPLYIRFGSRFDPHATFSFRTRTRKVQWLFIHICTFVFCVTKCLTFWKWSWSESRKYHETKFSSDRIYTCGWHRKTNMEIRFGSISLLTHLAQKKKNSATKKNLKKRIPAHVSTAQGSHHFFFISLPFLTSPNLRMQKKLTSLNGFKKIKLYDAQGSR